MSGSALAMISSLKSNKSLLKPRRFPKLFSKKPEASDQNIKPLSLEENLRIIEENKKLLKRKTRVRRIFGIALLLFYSSIIIYAMSVLL